MVVYGCEPCRETSCVLPVIAMAKKQMPYLTPDNDCPTYVRVAMFVVQVFDARTRVIPVGFGGDTTKTVPGNVLREEESLAYDEALQLLVKYMKVRGARPKRKTKATFTIMVCPLCQGMRVKPVSPHEPCNFCNGFGRVILAPDVQVVAAEPLAMKSVRMDGNP